MADSKRNDAEEIIEAASEPIKKPSMAFEREFEDVALHWRWITGAAIAAVLAVQSLVQHYSSGHSKSSVWRDTALYESRHQEGRITETATGGAEISMKVSSFEPIWMSTSNNMEGVISISSTVTSVCEDIIRLVLRSVRLSCASSSASSCGFLSAGCLTNSFTYAVGCTPFLFFQCFERIHHVHWPL